MVNGGAGKPTVPSTGDATTSHPISRARPKAKRVPTPLQGCASTGTFLSVFLMGSIPAGRQFPRKKTPKI